MLLQTLSNHGIVAAGDPGPVPEFLREGAAEKHKFSVSTMEHAHSGRIQ